MKVKHNSLAAAAVLAALAGPVAADPVLLTFEGVGDLNAIGTFYGGGAGTNFGVGFSAPAQALVDSDADGSGDFANAPSPDTIMVLSAEPNAVMNHAAGFAGGLSFWYSSTSAAFVAVHSELDLGGVQLATAVLRPSNDDDCPVGPSGKFCSWNAVNLSFVGIARSVNFRSPAGATGWDDIAFNSLGSVIERDLVLTPVPEPGTWAMMLLGLAAAVGSARCKARPA